MRQSARNLKEVVTSKDDDHTPQAIAARLSRIPQRSYLRDWVYGGVDGAITTFALVAGVTGARLSPTTVLILGLANLAADGFSMAASSYLGTRAESEELKHFKALEEQEIRRIPEGEREEVRQILRKRGFTGDLLERSVAVITSDPSRWVQLMLTEEYGLPLSTRSPWRSAIMTFSAFVLYGLIPLLPFLLHLRGPFKIASVLTGAVFFGIGSLRSRWSVTIWWNTGLQTLAVGAVASAVAYEIGSILKGIV